MFTKVIENYGTIICGHENGNAVLNLLICRDVRINKSVERVMVKILSIISLTLPGGSVVKNLPAKQEMCIWSLGWEDPMEKEMATHPVFLTEISHGQRSLMGYSSWGWKESDTI